MIANMEEGLKTKKSIAFHPTFSLNSYQPIIAGIPSTLVRHNT